MNRAIRREDNTCFEATVNDMRPIIHTAEDCSGQASAAMLLAELHFLFLVLLMLPAAAALLAWE